MSAGNQLFSEGAKMKSFQPAAKNSVSILLIAAIALFVPVLSATPATGADLPEFQVGISAQVVTVFPLWMGSMRGLESR